MDHRDISLAHRAVSISVPLRLARASHRRFATGRLDPALALSTFGSDSSVFRLLGCLVLRTARAKMSQESAQGPDLGAVVVEERPVVTGGHLKKGKSWAPDVFRIDGESYLPLSGNDYMMAQFLFGKVNGPAGRNLPRTSVVHRLWKARNERQAAPLAEERAQDAGQDAILAAIYAQPLQEPPQARRHPKGESESRKEQELRLAKLPETFPVAIPSSQEGKDIVTFVVARAPEDQTVAIELTKTSLEDLLAECEAELPPASADGTPKTPPRRTRSRQSPMFPSPGASSPRAVQGKKKARAAGTYHDKKSKQIVAKWRAADGSWKGKRFSVEDAGGDVERARAEALAHAQGLHCKSGGRGRPRR